MKTNSWQDWLLAVMKIVPSIVTAAASLIRALHS